MLLRSWRESLKRLLTAKPSRRKPSPRLMERLEQRSLMSVNPTAATFSATEAAAFSGTVASFTSNDHSPQSASNYSASIDWGDGHTSNGKVVANSGHFDVTDNHTYGDDGQYTVKVTINDKVDHSHATVQSTANVADQPLTLTGRSVQTTEGWQFNGRVATLNDPGTSGDPGDYSATIDWGDGTTTSGSLSSNFSGGFNVNGRHAYQHEGTYTAQVTVCEDGEPNTSVSATSTITVADADLLLPSNISVYATEGTSFSGKVATFFDIGYPGNSPGNFNATIDWGDGTTTTGSVSGSNGFLTVAGAHAYAEEGAYSVSAVLAENTGGNASATATGSALVAEADILVPDPISLSATEGAAYSGVVASFTNAGYPGNPPSSFSALIDWGDGTTTTGSVSGSNGALSVSGDHAYAEEGDYNVSVVLSEADQSGAEATATGTVYVADGDVLVPDPISLAATEGTLYSGTVATFTNTGYPDNPAGNFLAVIDWGDGTTTTGSVSGGKGSLSVSGDHTYAEEGDYNVSVVLSESDQSGAEATATGTISVAEADVLTANPITLTGTEGALFSGTVATFTNSGYPANPASNFSAVIDWGDGTSTTGSVSGSNGALSVSGDHTYAEEGDYNVSVVLSESDQSGAEATASGTASMAEADVLTADPISFAATEGSAFSGTVAAFTNSGYPDNPASNFSAVIDWGDGTTTTGSVSGNNGALSVSGDHTYAEEGDYNVSVALSESDQSGAEATASGTISVAEADVLTADPITLTGIEGSLFSGTVATFTNSGYPDNPASNFSAVIDWGDGTTTTGSVSGGKGALSVSGDHTYAEEGDYNVSVVLSESDQSGTEATATGTISIAEADILTADPITLTGTEGSLFSGTVATFTNSGYPANPASNFSAVIDWGDGTTTTGSVSGNNGALSVSGDHTYAEEGDYNVSVVLSEADQSGAEATATGTASVSEADVLTADPITLTGTEGTLFSGAVATFTNSGYPDNPASNFSAVIDWGDGTTTTGTVSGNNGALSVSGDHTYAEEGDYNVSVVLSESDQSGAEATASGTISVAEADVLTADPISLSATEGSSYSGAVATFTNSGYPANPASNFSAVIDWGDGTTTTGSVSGSNGSLSVSGDHTYAEEGDYNVSVVLSESDQSGAEATATGTASVADADVLTADPVSFAATEGSAFSGTVATFTNSGYPANPASNFSAVIDWGDGTTTTGSVSGSNGALSVSGDHTYAEEGDYNVGVVLSESDQSGAEATASGTISVAEADILTADPISLTGTEGTLFSGTVATFTNSGYPANLASNFTAVIDWGDGTTTTGSVSGNNGALSVSGDHTYAEEGDYNVSVVLSESDQSGAEATATGTASVAEADVLTADPITLTGTEGSLFSGTVATFTNSGYPANPASNFSAVIDWGDGTTTTGSVNGSNGALSVSGDHTYAEEGDYNVSVVLSEADQSGAGATATGTISVAEADVLTADPISLSATEGTLFSGTVATFTNSGYPANPASNFSAVIDWGDGTTTTGSVSGTNGALSVTGDHTYAEEGDYNVSVVLSESDQSGAEATAIGTISVADADVLVASALPISAIQGTAFSGHVATFTNSGYPANAASDFSSTIDWGDGTTTAGTITGSGGSFTVSGTHTYTTSSPLQFTVSVRDKSPGTATATAHGAVTIGSLNALTTDPPIVGAGVTLNGNEFTALSSVTVATFTHNAGGDPASNFTATIDWGDGTTTAGVVSLAGGTYSVKGSHTYSDEGSFAMKITVDDVPDGVSATIDSAAVMLEELMPDASRGTPNDRFISEVYREFLGRPVDPSALAFWGAQLAAGASRQTVAAEIIASTEAGELRNQIIDQAMQTYLHRSADAAALAFFGQFLASGGTQQQLVTLILSSDEYFHARGGSTNDGFLTALYGDVLNRGLDAAGKAACEQVLAMGMSRLQVVQIVMNSVEHDRIVVQQLFAQYLHRGADLGAVNAFVAELEAGFTEDQILAQILGSDEFFGRVAA